MAAAAAAATAAITTLVYSKDYSTWFIHRVTVA